MPYSRRLFAEEVGCNYALMWRAAVFPKVNTLPYPEREPCFFNRDGKIHRGKSCSNMGGHVVFPFHSVNEQRVAVRNKPAEKRFQIASNIRVGILLNQQRG